MTFFETVDCSIGNVRSEGVAERFDFQFITQNHVLQSILEVQNSLFVMNKVAVNGRGLLSPVFSRLSNRKVHICNNRPMVLG